MCCRQDFIGNGCDGTVGGWRGHQCVRDPNSGKTYKPGTFLFIAKESILFYFKIRTIILLQKLRQTLQIKLKTREKNAGIIVAVYKVVAHGAEVKECAVELIG